MANFIATRSVASVVTLDEVRAHLQLFGDTSFDVELGLMNEAAQQYVEDKIGEFIGSTTVIQPFKSFARVLPLDHRYISSITSVQYYNDSNVLTTVGTSAYTFDNSGFNKSVRLLTGQQWPSPVSNDVEYPVRVTYVAQLTPLPTPIIHAILMVIGDMFHSRWSGDRRTYQAPVAVDNLLFNYVRRGF